ncbi:hypothetical protein K440DRAFT_57913 [Wilcoxina mikolae CBS 423.85]|nr:hypothetical protein K440DRAFT_57913 [Wilcoxina mikolae CBS 423.85]
MVNLSVLSLESSRFGFRRYLEEPVFPLHGDLEADGLFFTALLRLSERLEYFGYSGRCRPDMFRTSIQNMFWPRLKKMSIQMDVLDTNGEYWNDIRSNTYINDTREDDSHYGGSLTYRSSDDSDDSMNERERIYQTRRLSRTLRWSHWTPLFFRNVPWKEKWEEFYRDFIEVLPKMPRLC